MMSFGPGATKAATGVPAGHGFEDHKAKGVGEAREDEYIGVGKVLRQLVTRLAAGKVYVSCTCVFSSSSCGPGPDHDLGAGQVEIEEGLDILLHRHPADIGEDRFGQVLVDTAINAAL